MDQKIFQIIFDDIQDYLPEGWEKVVYYAIYEKDFFQMKFYVLLNGKYISCHKFCKEKDLSNLFIKLHKSILITRKSSKEFWTCLTMSVTSDGHMKSYFDYNDIKNTSLYEKKWEKVFLK